MSEETFELGFRVFDAKNKMTEVRIESICPSAKLLIVIFMKQVKLIVTENHHFDEREESSLKNNFWRSLDYHDLDANINFNGF